MALSSGEVARHWGAVDFKDAKVSELLVVVANVKLCFLNYSAVVSGWGPGPIIPETGGHCS